MINECDNKWYYILLSNIKIQLFSYSNYRSLRNWFGSFYKRNDDNMLTGIYELSLKKCNTTTSPGMITI